MPIDGCARESARILERRPQTNTVKSQPGLRQFRDGKDFR